MLVWCIGIALQLHLGLEIPFALYDTVSTARVRQLQKMICRVILYDLRAVGYGVAAEAVNG